jgi:cytochrome c peroxidase
MPTRTPGAVTETELGRLLFWDPILSGDMDVACATCHHPDFAYADGLDLSLGTESVGLGPSRVQVPGSSLPPVKRNAQTVLNTAFNGLDDDGGRRRRGRGRERIGGDPVQFLQTLSLTRAPMFWDNRVRSLEEQALEPIKMQEEMRGDAFSEAAALDSVAARLRSNPEYVRLFDAVYDTLIGADQIGRAIAAFERTLVAVDSPFDRFMDGEEDALTPQQLRGLEEFRDADCDECHNGPMFSDYDLHVLGIAENPKLTLADPGAGRFQFRTPSLRNVALTAPYMHNGMLATLEDVLEFYDEGDSRNPNVADGGRGRRDRDDDGGAVAGLDRDFRSVDNMSRDEMRDIIAFLNALTDEDFDRTIPSSVPSGLPPGGAVATP